MPTIPEKRLVEPPAPLPSDTRPPSPAPAATSPTRDWDDARAAVRAAGRELNLARALALLLVARTDHETAAFERFAATFRRLPWKSALALGERGGYVQWGWCSREPNRVWATEGALAGCHRVSAAPCVIVIVDGKFHEAAFLEFASRLGARPRPVVRDAAVQAMHRRLEACGL